MSEPASSTAGTDFPDLPPAPPSRVVGQGYSANHPVPTVQSYKAAKADADQQADEYARIVAARQAEDEERMRKAAEAKDESASPVDAPKTDPSQKEEGQVDEKKGRDKVKEKVDPHRPTTEKERMMEQMNSNKSQFIIATTKTMLMGTVRPTDRVRHAEKGQRRVRDPITGAEIIVKDADPKGKLTENGITS
jgi:hypothetical protein